MHPIDQTINDYVDDALGRAERSEVERHLTTCDECRRLVDDLRDVSRRAAALAPVQPPARVWTGIEQAIRRGRRRRAYVRWSWLAAAAVVVLCTIVGLRIALPGRHSDGAESASGADNREIAAVGNELLQAEQHYRKAISGLEQITNAEKGALDPQTAATLERNLTTIDQAINESLAALKVQPNSEAAEQSLLDSFKTKVALLEDTIALINEMRKGNDAGAARIVSGLKRKS